MNTNKGIINFNNSEEELMRISEQKFDNGDLLGALKTINRRNKLHKPTFETYMFMADIFDEMEVFDLAINCWFKCLNCAPKSMEEDIFEGLGACYYNYGNQPQAAYYYNKVLQQSDEISTEAKLDIISLFTQSKPSNFKIVYPPEKVDYTQQIEQGISKIKEGEFKQAIEILSTVAQDNKQYFLAQNYMAICYLLIDELKKAEKICRNIIKEKPENIQAMSTLAAILTEGGNSFESHQLVQQLCSFKTENPDEIYKIATVCCENKMHKQAYKLFCTMEQQVAFDCTLKFFKAISAFNSGLHKVALNELDGLLDINPNYAVAAFYFRYVREFIDDPTNKNKELSYFYRIFTNEAQRRKEFFSKLLNSSKKQLEESVQGCDMKELLYWCFDEADGRELPLQQVAVIVATRLGFDEFLFDIMLNSNVNDLIKIECLRNIALRNKNNEFGMVICGIYKKVKFKALRLPTKKRNRFIEAYADCFAKYDMLDEGNSKKLRFSTAEIYIKMAEKNILDLADDVNSLSCAIYLNSNIESIKNKKRVIKEFGAKTENVNAILNNTKKEGKQNETI